jgi:hypothetical protein
MKMRLLAASLVIYSGIATSGVLLACGDKFLLPSRGTRFQQAPVDRISASILLYANPASPLPAALTKLSVDAALRKVGYRPTFVSSLDALERALSGGAWDVIVVDLADGAPVRGRVQGRVAPVLLAVAHNPTGEQFAQARKDYPRVLKSPSRSQAFVEAIDDALAARHAGAGPKSR